MRVPAIILHTVPMLRTFRPSWTSFRVAALATALFSAGLLTAAQPVSAPVARADGKQAVAPYFTGGIILMANSSSTVAAGTNGYYKIYGGGFPAVGTDPVPPPFIIEMELPNNDVVVVGGANLKSSTELRGEIPGDLLSIGSHKVRITTPETEHWLPSQGSGFATLTVLRSSSDIDCDGRPTAQDALILMNVIAGLDLAPKNCAQDANKSGGPADIADVTWIRQEVAGLIFVPLISSTP